MCIFDHGAMFNFSVEISERERERETKKEKDHSARDPPVRRRDTLGQADVILNYRYERGGVVLRNRIKICINK